MNKSDWIAAVRGEAGTLRGFVSGYHPAAALFASPQNRLPITAPDAEAACAEVRRDIRREANGNPVERFDEAVAAGDADAVYGFLNQTWFGVPESTSCWQIPGFASAVSLLEDGPEEEE